jgi:hypothetical protein
MEQFLTELLANFGEQLVVEKQWVGAKGYTVDGKPAVGELLRSLLHDGLKGQMDDSRDEVSYEFPCHIVYNAIHKNNNSASTAASTSRRTRKMRPAAHCGWSEPRGMLSISASTALPFATAFRIPAMFVDTCLLALCHCVDDSNVRSNLVNRRSLSPSRIV